MRVQEGTYAYIANEHFELAKNNLQEDTHLSVLSSLLALKYTINNYLSEVQKVSDNVILNLVDLLDSASLIDLKEVQCFSLKIKELSMIYNEEVKLDRDSSEIDIERCVDIYEKATEIMIIVNTKLLENINPIQRLKYQLYEN